MLAKLSQSEIGFASWRSYWDVLGFSLNFVCLTLKRLYDRYVFCGFSPSVVFVPGVFSDFEAIFLSAQF